MHNETARTLIIVTQTIRTYRIWNLLVGIKFGVRRNPKDNEQSIVHRQGSGKDKSL